MHWESLYLSSFSLCEAAKQRSEHVGLPGQAVLLHRYRRARRHVPGILPASAGELGPPGQRGKPAFPGGRAPTPAFTSILGEHPKEAHISGIWHENQPRGVSGWVSGGTLLPAVIWCLASYLRWPQYLLLSLLPGNLHFTLCSQLANGDTGAGGG